MSRLSARKERGHDDVTRRVTPTLSPPSVASNSGTNWFLLTPSARRNRRTFFWLGLGVLILRRSTRTLFVLSTTWPTIHHAGHQPLQRQAGTTPDGKQSAPRGPGIANFNCCRVRRAGTRRTFTTYGGVRSVLKSARLTIHEQRKLSTNNGGQRNNSFGPTMAITSTRRRSNGGTSRPTYPTFAWRLRLETTRCCWTSGPTGHRR